MKKLTLVAMTVCLIAAGTVRSQAASYLVDPTYNWIGWMNVYSIVGGGQGGYLWGSAWGVTDLPAYMTSTTLTLTPNTNTYNPANPYWVNPDGTGAKWMEANFYVDLGPAAGGTTITFSGDVIANTLVSPYSSVAFIKEFTSGYGWVGMNTAPLVTGQPFSVTRAIAPGNIGQFGFMTTGPNANPHTVDQLGAAIIAVPEPGALALACLGIVGVIALRRKR